MLLPTIRHVPGRVVIACAAAVALAGGLTGCAGSSGGSGGHEASTPAGGSGSAPAPAQVDAAPTVAAQHSSVAAAGTPPVFEIDAMAGMKYQLPAAKTSGGTVTVELVNKATDMPHEADLFLLHPGVTVAQFRKALLSGPDVGAVMGIAGPVGGPGGIGPGQSTSVTVHLEPNSTYGVICDIPAPDGKPHYLHGMIATFTTGADDGVDMPSTAQNTVTMTDDKYTVPGGMNWTKPVHVINKGTTVHQMQILGAAPGKSLADVESYLKLPPGKAPAGPPPYRAYGGVSVAVPGVTQTFTPHLKPGKYILICMVVDPKTHMPHFAMGMLTPFTVS